MTFAVAELSDRRDEVALQRCRRRGMNSSDRTNTNSSGNQLSQRHQRVTPGIQRVKLAHISVQRLERDQRVEEVDQPVEARAEAAAILVFEDLRESREGKRYPLRPSIFGRIDHVDAEPLVDPVRSPATTPRHIQADFAAAACGRIPMEALNPPRASLAIISRIPGKRPSSTPSRFM